MENLNIFIRCYFFLKDTIFHGLLWIGCFYAQNCFWVHLQITNGISCGIGRGRIARHNHVRDALFGTTVQAVLGPVREPEGLLKGSEDRPADVMLRAW